MATLKFLLCGDMGYHTSYTLTWAEQKATFKRVCQHAVSPKAKFCPECGASTKPVEQREPIKAEITKCHGIGLFEGIDSDGHSTDEALWYEHEAEMKGLSKVFPTVLFTLWGNGGEDGDLWQKYFLNGKMQVAKAVFPPFDPDQLA